MPYKATCKPKAKINFHDHFTLFLSIKLDLFCIEQSNQYHNAALVQPHKRKKNGLHIEETFLI